MKKANIIKKLLEMQKEFDDIFENVVEPIRNSNSDETEPWQPFTDIYETVDTFIVKMEIPGIDHNEDINIVLEGNRLIVKGNRPDRTQNQKEHYHQNEINYGSFYRSIQLPDLINEEAELKAKYRDGFLEIILPKRPIEHKNIMIEPKKLSEEQ